MLAKYPGLRTDTRQIPHQPGNVGSKRRDENFSIIARIAAENGKPVRIGVNWGSLDQDLLTRMMDENARRPEPASRKGRLHRSDVRERTSIGRARGRVRGGHDAIIISAKVSGVPDLVEVYRRLASRCDYPLHLGLTEAGMGSKGIVSSAAALAVLLSEGIGDTIRVSLTPKPNGDRTEEVQIAQQILQSLELRSFNPQVTACPGLRTDDVDVLPAHGGRHSDVSARPDACVAGDVSGRDGSEGCSHGMRGERPG